MPAALLAVALLAVCSLPSGARAHATFNERVEAAAEQISIAPGMAQPYLQRAGVYHAHGDWDAALADIEQARRIEPALADLGFLRGRILVSAGRFADAEAALTRYLALRPDDPR
ncbi:MAG: tetratricopeptide repeat protein, partial [Deltaproteobacteria bacterium]|nr:tetratricopeptide repeat protein [Deltaproteobacteria bacterium]